MATRKKPISATSPRPRRTVRVRIEGQDYRARIAEVKPRGRRKFAFTPEVIKRASSPWWFWSLERPLADALAQALIEAGVIKGFESGSALVASLRKKYS